MKTSLMVENLQNKKKKTFSLLVRGLDFRPEKLLQVYPVGLSCRSQVP